MFTAEIRFDFDADDDAQAQRFTEMARNYIAGYIAGVNKVTPKRHGTMQELMDEAMESCLVWLERQGVKCSIAHRGKKGDN